MGLCLKKDTLAYQLGFRPNTSRISLERLRVPLVVSKLNQLMAKDYLHEDAGLGYQKPLVGPPEIDALMFYLMNHAVSVLRSQVSEYDTLTSAQLELVTLYHKELAVLSARMFNYLLLICTRESRHVKEDYNTSLWDKMKSEYGLVVKNFHKKIKGCSSTGAASVFREDPPDMLLGDYTKFLVDIFYQGSYSSGFGGKAWGAVADVLHRYVSGELSAELMMDTAFTLCHNNGPIFNKGMLFDHYSDTIKMILDVQRSGQIPQLLAEPYVEKYAKNIGLVRAREVCMPFILPTLETPYVDWFKVQQLGALGNYSSQQQIQVNKHGHPSAKKDTPKQAPTAYAGHYDAEANEYIQLCPNVKIKKAKSPRKEKANA